MHLNLFFTGDILYYVEIQKTYQSIGFEGVNSPSGPVHPVLL